MLDKHNEVYLNYIREILDKDNIPFTGSITLNCFKGVIGNVHRKPENFEPAFNFEETVVLKR
jgi:hypothetical protein